MSAVADYSVTFAGIVFPGETLNVNVWEDDDRLLITTTVADRDDAPALQNVVLTRR